MSLAWNILDEILHGVILCRDYQQTVALWRPFGEMKLGLIRLVELVAAITFVAIYALRYGLLYGIGAGVSMGYGSYAVMPITHEIACAWFAGSLVESIAGAILIGLIIKE
ncbi:MAG: hypothetical protein NTX71_01845 [Candidatus Aureabacteria bacterium]|nr:hypothetical protein [Candidatus Auribacterota bacterium]